MSTQARPLGGQTDLTHPPASNPTPLSENTATDEVVAEQLVVAKQAAVEKAAEEKAAVAALKALHTLLRMQGCAG